MNFWDFPLIRFSQVVITPLDLLEVILILLIARFLIWFITRFLVKRIFSRNRVDVGRQYAVVQLIKYVVYTFTLLLCLQTLGISLSILLAGSAALLVGLGLGLQQTFNDLFSGVILLGEGTVEVDDVLEVDNTIGRVVAIGLRTSKLISRDGIDLIIPNSLLVTRKVINWSHFQSSARFQVNAGVAYSSDVDLVIKLLQKAAEGHQGIMESPPPTVMFNNFGDSSLDFILHFYSTQFWDIEYVKSDLRKKIWKAFKENDVTIPFPQRDVWIKSEGS